MKKTVRKRLLISGLFAGSLCAAQLALLGAQDPALGQPAPPKISIDPQRMSGTWILDRAQSDDADEKMKGRDEDIPLSGSGQPAPDTSSRGTNDSRTNRRRSNAPSAGPLGGPAGTIGLTDKDREDTLEILRPSESLTIKQAQGEFDVTEDENRMLIFFTDGRKLKQSKDEKYQEIAAQWQGGRLVSDERGPHNARLSRAFEMSADGQQLHEILMLDNSRIFSPLLIRYVYDPAHKP